MSGRWWCLSAAAGAGGSVRCVLLLRCFQIWLGVTARSCCVGNPPPRTCFTRPPVCCPLGYNVRPLSTRRRKELYCSPSSAAALLQAYVASLTPVLR